MTKTVVLLNPMGTDVTNFVNGTVGVPQLLKGTLMGAGDSLYTLPYDNTSGVANVEAGVALLDTKLKATTGQVLVFGYSEGCQIADWWLTNQGSAPASGVDPADVSFLLIANANRKYGGFCYNHAVFDAVGFTEGKPADTPYTVTDFARQYDGVSDFPTATPIVDALVGLESVGTDANAISGAMSAVAAVVNNTTYANAALNAVTGLVVIHNNYLLVTVDDPTNVVLQEDNITWVWSPTYPVPLLGIGATYPQSDLQLRTQIEQAYSRPVQLPLPDYGTDNGWGVEPFTTPVTPAPVTGWWAESREPGALTGSGTLSVSANVIVHDTVTLTGSGALSAVAVSGIFRTAPFTGSGVLASTASAIVPYTVGLSGSGVLSSTVVQQFQATATLSGSGALTAVGVQQFDQAGSLTGSGNLSVTAIQKGSVTANLSGSGSLTAAVYAVEPDLASLTGSGVLSTSAAAKVPRTVALSGSGVLSTVSVQRFPWTVNLQAPGTLTAAVVQQYQDVVLLTGSGVLSSSVVQQFATTVALTGSGALSAAGVQSYSTTTAFTGTGSLTATVSSIEHTTAALTGSGALTAAAVQQYLDTGSLTGSGVLSASALIGASATVTLTGSGSLSATVYAVEPETVPLTGSGSLSATTLAKVPATASLSGSGVLTTAAIQQFQDTAALTGSGVLAVSAAAIESDTAALTGTGSLSATVVAKVPVTATLSGSGVLSTTSVQQYQNTAALTGTGALSSTVSAIVPRTVALTGSGALTASTVQSYSGTAALTGSGALSASVIAQYQDAATLTGSGVLSATAAVVPSGPSYDALGTGDTTGSGSWTHTVATSGSYVLAVYTTYAGSITMKCGGVSMTLLASINDGSSDIQYLFGLSGVSAGAKTMTVATTTATLAGGNSISFTTVTSVGTPVTNTYSTTPASKSVTCSAGQIIVQSFSDAYDANITSYSGGTSRYLCNSSPFGGNVLTLSTATASTTFTETLSAAYPTTSIAVVIS